MLRLLPLSIVLIVGLALAGCSDDPVIQTGSVEVKVDESVDFTEFQTFSVVTADLVDPPPEVPDLGDEQEAFNDFVNQLIIEAMQAEPVCLQYIPPDEVTDENQPDLWAANGLARSTDSGYVYGCCGGWWWGYWGWYWDPCAFWCPVYVEYDVGSLFVPVGPPPAEGEDPAAVFAGLARSLTDTGTPPEQLVRVAIEEIFRQWPNPRQCPQ